MAENAAFATLGGAPVLGGTLTLPLHGVWTARLRVGAMAPLPSPLDLVLGDLTLRGTVAEGGAPYGRWDVLVVGGAHRLGVPIEPNDFLDAPARIVLDDTLAAAGEVASAAPDAATLGRMLPSWARARGTGGAAVAALARALGALWRVTPDGGVWLGVDAGAPTTATGTRLDERPAERARVYALERFALLPGQTFEGRRVGDVHHTLGPEGTRTVVWTP